MTWTRRHALRTPSPVASALPGLLAVLGLLAMPACIDGGTIGGTVEPDFLGDAVGVDDTTDADASETSDDGGSQPDDGGPIDEELPDTEVESGCATDRECRQDDDGNLCNGTFACVGGACVEVPAVDEAELCADAGDAGPCHVNACNPATGSCEAIPAARGTACDDGNPCTVQDRCIEGACESGLALQCDDGHPCTLDGCVGGECDYQLNPGAPCDDGNPCTIDDTCTQNGATVGCTSVINVCPCTESEQCPDSGDTCFGELGCNGGLCKPASNLDTAPCDQIGTGPCEVVRCDGAGECAIEAMADGSACDDGDACTIGDYCEAGACVAGEQEDCNDNPCAAGACSDGACQYGDGASNNGDACGELTTPCGQVEGVCAAGACVPPADHCECVENTDCTDDGDACNGAEVCQAGACVSQGAVTCDDGGPCQTASCDPATGDCSLSDVADGEACEDGDACTFDETCTAGVCEGAGCDAPDGCGAQTCVPWVACVAIHYGGACDDGSGCSAESSCVGGACTAAVSVNCPDGGQCATSTCDDAIGACVTSAQSGACDDGDSCTENDACQNGVCKGEPKVCDDGNPCTFDSCSGGSCANAPQPAVCDDGNPCTVGDQCQSGTCLSGVNECECGVPADCAAFDDGDDCTPTLTCEAGQCVTVPGTETACDPADGTACEANVCQNGSCVLVPRPDGIPCEDGNACSSSDKCDGGTCTGNVIDCDDGNPCTADLCDPTIGCTLSPTTAGCDDGVACNGADSCEGGFCLSGTEDCGCTNDTDCAAQEDGNACNGTLVCQAGSCVVDASTIVHCDVADSPCEVASCDPGSGSCTTSPAGDGGACSDGNPCTTGDTCASGVCQGDALDCDDGNPCTEGTCKVDSGCVQVPLSKLCDDGNPCTDNDNCSGGVCQGNNTCGDCLEDTDCDTFETNCGPELVCDAGSCSAVPDTAVVCDTSGDAGCQVTKCDEGTGACTATTLALGSGCDDGDPCTEGSTCDAAGDCVGAAPLDCDDGNPCTTDGCGADGCVNTGLAEGAACDDGDACTENETCVGGECETDAAGLVCACSPVSPCPDVNICDGNYSCIAGKCHKNDPVVCPPSTNPCLPLECQPDSGSCMTNPQNGTPCDDGDPCTTGDSCFAVGMTSACTGFNVVCDDGEPCTEDACEGGACSSTPSTGEACDDGDPCTADTVCNAGVCGSGSEICACTEDSECAAFDDGDLCNGIWTCQSDVCAPAPATEVTCSDDDPFDCTGFECNPSNGLCVEVTEDAGTPCNDGSLCTDDETCQLGGACEGTAAFDCTDTDANDCLVHHCDPLTGVCGFKAAHLNAACDDGNPCTEDDRCGGAACQGTPVDCDDGEDCTEDACSADTGCFHTDLYGPCEDGDPCTAEGDCANGACVALAAQACDCTGDSDCDVFDDGNACNGTFSCIANACVAVPPVACDSGAGDCQLDSCDPATGVCSLADKADGVACDDGDLCTANDACTAGVCSGAAANCDDGNPCTTDLCLVDQGCWSGVVNNGTACDDGEPCNGADQCEDGLCKPGSATACLACSTDADCVDLEDGNLCNGTLRCLASTCTIDPTTLVGCPDDGTGCATSACDPGSGSCLTTQAPNGQLCDDGDPCTAADTCAGGVCEGTPLVCEDGDPCTTGDCVAGFGCVHAQHSGPCDDGNPCTLDEHCDAGVCTGGVANPCDDDNPCTAPSGCLTDKGCQIKNVAAGTACNEANTVTAGTCNAGVCEATSPGPCGADIDCVGQLEDNCAGQLTCNLAAGQCELVPGTAVVCEDDDCATQTCNPGNGACDATPINEGGACDDGDACTDATTCAGGVCSGTPVTCSDTGDDCAPEVCHPVTGCQVVHVTGPCEDGGDCSVSAQCLAGVCQPDLVAPFSEDFESGTSDWQFTTTGATATCQVATAGAITGGFGIYCGNGATGTAEDAGGAWTAFVTLPSISLPTVLEYSVNYRVRVAGAGMTIAWSANGSAVTPSCQSVPDGTEACSIELSSLLNSNVELTAQIDAATGTEADGVGVMLDTFQSTVTCID